MASIGQKIKYARKSAGMTQAELARRTKISRSYVGAIEIDQYNPSVSTLQLIAHALKVPTRSLLADEPETGVHVYNLSADESKLVDNYRELNAEKKRLVQSVVFQFGDHKPDKITAPVSAKVINGNLHNSGGNFNSPVSSQ